MLFKSITIPNTVIAYNVIEEATEVGQIWLRDEYWHGHARTADGPQPVQGGNGFVRGRGYEGRNAAGIAVIRAVRG